MDHAYVDAARRGEDFVRRVRGLGRPATQLTKHGSGLVKGAVVQVGRMIRQLACAGLASSVGNISQGSAVMWPSSRRVISSKRSSSMRRARLGSASSGNTLAHKATTFLAL